MSEEAAKTVEAAVDRLAAVVNLPIDPAYRAGVVETFAGLMRAAALVLEFPLPDTVEPPSVFRP